MARELTDDRTTGVHSGVFGPRRFRARDLDPERDWRDVPDGSIQECPVGLAFLDSVSWRFYLPAYIRYGLRHPNEGAPRRKAASPNGMAAHIGAGYRK